MGSSIGGSVGRQVKPLSIADLISSVLASILTVMVLSYLVGDNPLFRVAMHLLVGSAAGYAGAVAINNVLGPGLVDPILAAGLEGLLSPSALVTVLVPWILVITLMLKVSPATSRFGTPAMALLVGVGAAVVVGGAITGTLLPQSLTSMRSLNPAGVASGESLERLLELVIVLVGTLSTLFYFRFSRRASGQETPLAVLAGLSIPGPLSLLRSVGGAFIAITFGVMYAGAVAASLIVLAERVQFLSDTLSNLLGVSG
jgi:hypothetical protein